MHSTAYTLVRGEDEDEDEIELEIEYSVTPYDPGRTYGPPEHCYPPEGGEVEELSAFRDGKPFPLTDAERDQIEQHIYETHDYSEDRRYG